MIRCFHCGIDNMDGSEYCDECGARLGVAASSHTPNYAPPPQLPQPPTFTRDPAIPKPAIPYAPPPPPIHKSGPAQSSGRPAVSQSIHPRSQTSPLKPDEQRAVTENNDASRQSKIEAQAKLVIQRGGKVGKEFPISGSESLIGRWDADGGIFPDIDLDQDDPEAKVSRRHARIQILNNQYLIEDLGSTNGTYINRGPRLLPGNKQPLKHGDEIIVGKTFLKFILS